MTKFVDWEFFFSFSQEKLTIRKMCSTTATLVDRTFFFLAIVRVTASKNNWMASDKLQKWLARVWGPNSDDVRQLLVRNQTPIHKTQAAKNAIAERDRDVVYLPASCTSLLQPADVFWNRPFKANLQRSWEMFTRKDERTPKGNLWKPPRQDALNFVSEA